MVRIKEVSPLFTLLLLMKVRDKGVSVGLDGIYPLAVVGCV